MGPTEKSEVSMSEFNAYSLNINLLTSEEKRVIRSILQHIEKDSKKTPIALIAQENYVSTAFIYKMCKRLGFDGYSELFYYLTQARKKTPTLAEDSDARLIANYSKERFQAMKDVFDRHRGKRVYAIGKGFEELVAQYMADRLSLFGYSGYTNLMFYNNTVYKDRSDRWVSNNEPSFLIAVSQSGNTREIVDNVKVAKDMHYEVLLFTRNDESTLTELSDLSFVVAPEKQGLIAQFPNLFHGKAILAFEKLLSCYVMGCVPEEI